jgi:hypothetical protein
MVAARLPDEGELRIGSVTLPAGKLITGTTERKGQPLHLTASILGCSQTG